MILCVAERANRPDMSEAHQARAEATWRRAPMRCILGCSALTHGPSRKRLTSVLGLPDDVKVVNLLWPSRKCGEWHEVEARQYAKELRGWLSSDGHFTDEWLEPPHREPVTLLVLLGRRVASAFGLSEAPFGTRIEEARRRAGAPVMKMLDFRESLSVPAEDPWEAIPCLVLPHPSGRSRTMNDEAEAERIRSIVRSHL